MLCGNTKCIGRQSSGGVIKVKGDLCIACTLRHTSDDKLAEMLVDLKAKRGIQRLQRGATPYQNAIDRVNAEVARRAKHTCTF
jgi:hypothetical protein